MRTSSALWIRGGRVLDPATGRDEVADVYVVDGRLAAPPAVPPVGVEVVDATGLTVVPGLTDVHVHLREPGGEAAETVASGAAAAAAGGFTCIVAMPNTVPPIDTPERVEQVLAAGRAACGVRVLTTACLTRDRAGQVVAPLAELAAAGAVAFTDDGCTVQSDAVMTEAMRQAAELGLPVMDHAQDRTLELAGGVMHEGARSRAFGLPGIPAEAELRIVARDLEAAGRTGAAIHIQHVSCGASVDLIQAALRRGVRVTAEGTPHHLYYCEDDIDPERPDRFKMNPPLRTAADRDRLRAAMADGTLAILATDHAPHTHEQKQRGFQAAPFGVVGLETAVGVSYTVLVRAGLMDRLAWLRAWTTQPAQLLHRPAPTLVPGAPADLVLLDLDRPWTVDPEAFRSKSRNTAFAGCRLYGRAVATFVDGRRLSVLQ